MKTKAIITKRNDQQTRGILPSVSAEAESKGLNVESNLSSGTLVNGDEQTLRSLEDDGYRVKILTDTNLLKIGSYEINTDSDEPKLAASEEVPRGLKKAWKHYLVQLIAPPTEEWVKEIESQGVDVIEPISAYGLFVIGDSKQVADLKKLDFVEWTGEFKPAYRIAPNLAGKKGVLKNVSISYVESLSDEDTRAEIEALGAKIISETTQQSVYHVDITTVQVEVNADKLNDLAALTEVRWLEYNPKMEPYGEREVQILAENFDGATAPDTAPITGYQAWLSGVGLSGNGLTIAICDTGVDANANNNTTAHTDLLGRQVAFVDYTGGAVTADTDGHGTNVAGIALGSGATGQTEAASPANFLWGQGVAPQSNYVTQNFLLASPQPPTVTLFKDAVNNGANVMNNSWGRNDSGGSGYTAGSREIDIAVRDPNTSSAGLENMIIVCAAGNSGGRNVSIGAPHESKNDIVVGNSLTSRPGLFPSDDVRGIAGTSSRGLAVDGRILPTVVAPGTNVSATFSRAALPGLTPIAGTGTPDPMNPGSLINQYVFMTGTSQASPHVAGSCSLLMEWWRNRTGGHNPSPALIKALLINGAEDLQGGENWRCLNRVSVDKSAWTLHSGSIFKRTMAFTPNMLAEGNNILTSVATLANITSAGRWFYDAVANLLYVRTSGSTSPGADFVPFLQARDNQPVPAIPNGHQGWGRVSLQNMVLQAPASDRGPKIFSDQRHAFTMAGQEHNITISPVSNIRPLRITLVWTDAPGAVGGNPALVNDLDLEVREVATGNIFRGNVFSNGFSVTGGSFDHLNNIECVYVQNPSGLYEVSIIASTISASANPTIPTPWQDFALVIDNAEYASSSPVNIVPVIDRSGSMIGAGYVEVTRASSRQFVDLMSVNDSLGVVSFGDSSIVEYPSPAGMQVISGQAIRDAARAEIDDITFGGCTFMGAGINEASSLLSTVSGTKAIVLLSDGYDNKGCSGDPTRPSALDAIAALPGDIPIYSCAMGPLSDQALLEQLGTDTNGQYYFMPTIDDLFEIYNYIRGQVSGDSIIVNESALASSSRLAGFVDALSSEVTFSVAWNNPKLTYVPRDAKKRNEISIRLRDSRGKLLNDNDSYVKRIVGNGYVIFTITDPMPGQWFVEVSTMLRTHTRYTVGGFVNSPIRLIHKIDTEKVTAKKPFNILTSVFNGNKLVDQTRGTVQIVNQSFSTDDILKKFKRELADIKPNQLFDGDGVPKNVGKIIDLRNALIADGKKDLFEMKKANERLKSDNNGNLNAALTLANKSTSNNLILNVSGSADGTKFIRKDLRSIFAH